MTVINEGSLFPKALIWSTRRLPEKASSPCTELIESAMLRQSARDYHEKKGREKKQNFPGDAASRRTTGFASRERRNRD